MFKSPDVINPHFANHLTKTNNLFGGSGARFFWDFLLDDLEISDTSVSVLVLMVIFKRPVLITSGHSIVTTYNLLCTCISL